MFNTDKEGNTGATDQALLNLFNNNKSKFGSFETKTLLTCETKYIEKANPYAEYKLTYAIQRSSKLCKDSFKFILQNNQLKIVGYTIMPFSK